MPVEIAGLLGLDTQDQTRVATAVSEIARNAFQYAGGGKAEGAGNGARGAKAKQGAVQSESQGGGDEPAV